MEDEEFQKLRLLRTGNLIFAKFRVREQTGGGLSKQRLARRAANPCHQACARVVAGGAVGNVDD
eukprot:5350570-Pyramimonas_sp.AAC.1